MHGDFFLSVINARFNRKQTILIVAFSVGIALRVCIAGVGFTFDMQSYEIVGKAVTAGKIVYNETTRYNYGPVWFTFIGFLYVISSFFSETFLVFRFLIVALLTAVDVFLCVVLLKKFGFLPAIFFILNPVSIILTGYYSQFDNLAVLVCLIGVIIYEKSNQSILNKNFFLGLILLGVSLSIKHIFFAFPLWISISERQLNRKLLSLLIPLLVFAIGFLPFLPFAFDSIVNNVFKYVSFSNAPLWTFIVPDYLKRIIRKEFFFFVPLVLYAFIFKKRNTFEKALLYSAIIVIFSYSAAEQYFAIPLIIVSAYMNIFFLAFSIVITFFLWIMIFGEEATYFGLQFARWNFSFTPMVITLIVGLIYSDYKRRYEQIKYSHVILLLIFLNVITYGFLLIPSYIEDKKIEPIEQALEEGNYEKANVLYGVIEKNPPFAGSRFYQKLALIRYSIEYYRIYKNLQNIYKDPAAEKNWIQIERNLRHIPATLNHKDRSNVIDILLYAQTEKNKML